MREWMPALMSLNLPSGRDYVLLVYLPPQDRIDLRTPENARRSLIRVAADMFSDRQTMPKLGHLIIGWRCGSLHGLVSQTGEESHQGLHMALQGWGLTPFLSTFTDGRLVPAGEITQRFDALLEEGAALVMAVRVSAGECEALRAELIRYSTHPTRPARNYSLLARPERYEGGGCLSVGLHLVRAAGILSSAVSSFTRVVELPEAMFGAGRELPKGVRPHLPTGRTEELRAVPLARLLLRDWGSTGATRLVRVPDPEAFFSALARLRHGKVADDDWRLVRAMGYDDAMVQQAAVSVARWAAEYPVRWIADPDGVSALVLEPE